MNEANFLGFRQVSLSYFSGLTDENKKGYLWFVRDKSGETQHAEIYLGTRKYGELNEDDKETEKLNNLIEAMGDMVDEEGNWFGFPYLEISGDTLAEFLENLVSYVDKAVADEASARDAAITSAISAEASERDAAIEAAVADEASKRDAAITSAISAEESARNAAISSAVSAEASAREGAIASLSGVVESVESELIEAINQESELREESDEALSGMVEEVEGRVDNLEDKVQKLLDLGVLHFAGVASAVSGDTLILMDGTEVQPSSANTGEVWLVGKAEYASNGEHWIELGDDDELAKLIEEINALKLRVSTLELEHVIEGDDVES